MIGLREEKGLSMYKIIMTHNRPWTKRELLLFIVLFVLVTSVLVRLFKKKELCCRRYLQVNCYSYI